LGFARHGRRKELADVGVPRDNRKFRVTGKVRGEIGGVLSNARGFELAREN
jgi:hypothetical protein